MGGSRCDSACMQGRPARSHIARVAHRVRTILGAPRGSGTSFSRLDLPSSRTTGAWAGPNRCACCRRRGPEPIAGSRAPAVACLWHARCLHAVWSGELQVPHRHKRHRHKRPMPRLGGALTLPWSRLPWIGLDLPTGAWEAREHDRPPTSPGAAAAGLDQVSDLGPDLGTACNPGGPTCVPCPSSFLQTL